MKAIRFKEFRLYTSFDRALWCALIWPFILALNPLFLEAGESLSTAMIDAPGFALLFSLCVDYTTYDDYRSGVFELIGRPACRCANIRPRNSGSMRRSHRRSCWYPWWRDWPWTIGSHPTCP